MKNYTLKELQEIELQILIDFHGFCAEHGLQYYLIGGALLGAAKYQKCIPWDDDMDVAMPREDYERLKQIFKSDWYFLQNGQSDPVFSRCIQKIRLNHTIIAEKDCVGLDMHQGIYIDIFPIDYVSHDCPKTLKKRASAIRHLMSLRAIKGGYHSGRYGSVFEKIFGHGVTEIQLHFEKHLSHDSVQNAYLQTLLYFGLIGCFAMIFFILSQVVDSVRFLKTDRFAGAFSLSLVLSAAAMMFTNTAIIFTSAIDSFFLTAFFILVPKYIRNSVQKESFLKE